MKLADDINIAFTRRINGSHYFNRGLHFSNNYPTIHRLIRSLSIFRRNYMVVSVSPMECVAFSWFDLNNISIDLRWWLCWDKWNSRYVGNLVIEWNILIFSRGKIKYLRWKRRSFSMGVVLSSRRLHLFIIHRRSVIFVNASLTQFIELFFCYLSVIFSLPRIVDFFPQRGI